MNKRGLESFEWSHRRWWVTLGMVFVAHVGAVLWFSNRTPVLLARPGDPPVFRMLDMEEAEKLPEFQLASDPALLVLAHPHTFSGAAWMASADDYDRTHWSEPLRWLPLPEGQLGRSFELFVRTNPPPAFQLTEKLPIRAGFLQLLPPAETIRTQSALRVEGPLRLSEPAPALPVWSYNDVLKPTVVEIAVDRFGQVQSARLSGFPGILDGRSGLNEADSAALGVARTLQFEPAVTERLFAADSGVVWGRLIFQWHARPAPRTEPAQARVAPAS